VNTLRKRDNVIIIIIIIISGNAIQWGGGQISGINRSNSSISHSYKLQGSVND
jgi:hypothetical protein